MPDLHPAWSVKQTQLLGIVERVNSSIYVGRCFLLSFRVWKAWLTAPSESRARLRC